MQFSMNRGSHSRPGTVALLAPRGKLEWHPPIGNVPTVAVSMTVSQGGNFVDGACHRHG
jgi:hypothetical protein